MDEGSQLFAANPDLDRVNDKPLVIFEQKPNLLLVCKIKVVFQVYLLGFKVVIHCGFETSLVFVGLVTRHG